MYNKPILSICMPTYNRADYLKKSIQSIIETKIFSEASNIEIVVSDNASTDDTTVVMDMYESIYPERIKYHRNDINVKDKNFEIVLLMAKGMFRKLANDNIIYSEETLVTIVNIIKINMKNRPLLFFSNGTCYVDESIIKLHTVNDFLINASYFSTWIGAFGLWDNQLEYITKFSVYHQTQLIQVKLIYEILKDNPESLIINDKLFIMYPIKNKSSYDVLKIFGFHYINILKEYPQYLSLENIELEKRKVLFGHIIPYYFDFEKQRAKAVNKSYLYLYKTYKRNWYFYFCPVVAILYYISNKAKSFIPQPIRRKVRNLIMGLK